MAGLPMAGAATNGVEAANAVIKQVRVDKAADLINFLRKVLPQRRDKVQDIQNILSQPDNWHVEPYVEQFLSYMGSTAAGTTSANTTILDRASQPSDDGIIIIEKASIMVQGKTGVVTLIADVFGIAGATIDIVKPKGRTLSIPVDRILNMAWTGESATTGAKTESLVREFMGSPDDPLAVIFPNDTWKIKLANVTANTVVAGHGYQVVLSGRKLVSE